jgi:hypothetical protein
VRQNPPSLEEFRSRYYYTSNFAFILNLFENKIVRAIIFGWYENYTAFIWEQHRSRVSWTLLQETLEVVHLRVRIARKLLPTPRCGTWKNFGVFLIVYRLLDAGNSPRLYRHWAVSPQGSRRGSYFAAGIKNEGIQYNCKWYLESVN